MNTELIDRQEEVKKQGKEVIDPEMQKRAEAVRDFRSSYWSLMNKTGFGNKSTTQETLRWLSEMKLTDDKNEQKSIYWREDFINKDGSLILEQGENLYQTFTGYMRLAAPFISKESHKRWFERLYDTSAQSSSTSSFKIKMAWVQSELGNYVSRWKQVAEDRDALVKKYEFNDVILAEPDLAILNDREKFLNLHFTERKGILAKAKALLNAQKTSRMELFTSAKTKLESAVSKGSLLNSKVGIWLERIFESKASQKKIQEFISGNSATSLNALLQNWADVKNRFDAVTQKAKEQGIENAPHGFKVIATTAFLSMHYAQRLSYVKQGEERLNDAKNIENELPIFLKIRHAMDMKDWSDASMLISAAKLKHLKDSDWPRLKAMELHVARFSGKGTAIPVVPDIAADSQKRLHMIMEQMEHSHSEMVPIVKRLLSSPNANRGIHQLRWIAYNNIWCRTHGGPYLDDEIARNGASTDQAELTKHRAEQGIDIGRHDGLDHSTSDADYFRKHETSRHKATFLHANMGAGGVVSALGEKLEHEQDPRWLYWTTLCPHHNGEPKPEGWMREFMQILTEIRSLTRPSA